MRLSKIRVTAALIFAAALSILFNVVTHVYDNKYYGRDADGIAGVANVTWDQAKKTVCLISGWEFYNNKLYEPNDFKNNNYIPDANINIGEYLGFEHWNEGKNPHGFGTYRIMVLLDDTERAYTIDMPEIYSSSKLYVNGKLMVQNGNPDPENYDCEIINTTIDFTAKDKAEIIIQTADYDHYYSGIIYPPIFGVTVAVKKLANLRQLFANTYILTALIAALLFLAFYFTGGKEKKNLVFSAFCLCYFIYSSYPIVHSIFNVKAYFWYCAEDVGFIFMLGILAYFGGANKSRKWILGVSAAVAALMFAVSYNKGNLTLYKIYGNIFDWYKVIVFSYIIICSTVKLYKSKNKNMLFAFGSIFFAISVAFDYSGMWYEPVVLGWGAMTGGFAMCITAGTSLLADMLKAKRQNTELLINNTQTKKYIDDVIHDLKSPLFGITSLAEMSRAGIQDDDFLSKIEERAFELAGRIDKLSEKRISQKYVMNFTVVNSLDYLKYISENYKVIADNKNIVIIVAGKSFEMKIDAEKLGLALENLIINAIRNTEKGGHITLEAYKDDKNFGLAVHDDGIGMSAEQIPNVAKRGISTQKNHMGIGLSIVREAAALHGGDLFISSKENEGSTFLITISQ